jgi:hypothetical protein
MSKLSNKYFLLFGVLFTAAFLGSCSSSTTPGSNSSITVPGVGSTFIMDNQTLDSNNVVLSSDTSTETFAKTGQSMFGKSNVVELVDSHNGGGSDTTYVNYESNSDISIYISNFPGNGMNAWWTIPFASQSTAKLFDSTASGIHVTVTVAGAGQGTLTINGQSVSTEKATLTMAESDTVAGVVVSMSSVTTAQFAPSLGEIVETDNPATRNLINGQLGTAKHEVVLSYTLH